jgi:prepilin-type N-terminal cleavage/methylation domain-containing protein
MLGFVPGVRLTAARNRGFTIVELMVTLAVAAILVALAVPTYRDVRERSIVRGASGDLVALVTQAKFEAAKRNDYVTMSVRGSGSSWCIGLQIGTTGCDCSTDTCNITQVNTSELNGARLLAAADFNDPGGGKGTTDVTIDPRLGMLKDLGTGGSIVVRSPSDNWDFRVQFNLSSAAKTNLCSPSGGRSLSDYPSC